MDVKLSYSASSLSSSSPASSGKQFDFCDDLSEHGYGSLEDLNNCPNSTSNGSPMVKGCDVSSSSLPITATTTTVTSSSPSSSPPLSSASSIDSIASLNNSSSSSSSKSMESTEQPSTSSTPLNDSNLSHRNDKTTGDQNSDKNNNNPTNSIILNNLVGNSFKESNHRCKENVSGDLKNDQKIIDGKVQSSSPQMLQSGNRFRFVPKNRQTNSNDPRFGNGVTFQSNGGRNNNRGQRKGTRSESDYGDNRKRSQIRNKNNEDIVFIIKRVDRSLRRTVSESSGGESQPVRGILKYPRDWNRRTQSESNCDNSEQSNLMDSHENGQTQSLECISPLEASCEASTESASSSAGEQSPGHDEEKPKKSVHFNCYVSKATFNINSTILNNNNKHSGSNKKKNRRHNSSNNPTSNNNDHKNTTTNSIKQNTNKPNKDNHPNNQPNQTSRWKSQQSHLHQQNHSEPSNNQTKPNASKPLTDQQQSVDCDENAKITTDSVILSVGEKQDQSENIDPMETKFRSRQDSGYDSETSDRRGFVEDSGTTTCVKSPNRQFTVKKVDLK